MTMQCDWCEIYSVEYVRLNLVSYLLEVITRKLRNYSPSNKILPIHILALHFLLLIFLIHSLLQGGGETLDIKLWQFMRLQG